MSKKKELFSFFEWDEQEELREQRKRRREVVIVFLVAFLFSLLTWFEIRLFSISHELPFVHSIFFFGLVNFNIVLLLFLLFMIFRNLVKIFVERRGKIFGSSLKAKLVAAFVAFSFIPTVLVFMTSVFYINSSFDKWFSVKMAGVLKSSLEVTKAYYFNAKKKNYHFAHLIANQVSHAENPAQVRKILQYQLKQFSLDAVEYYPKVFGERMVVLSDDEAIPEIPKANLEFLQKGIKSQVEDSTIHQFDEGNLVRVIVPVKEGSDRGAIVVNSFVPLSLISKMKDITSAYDEFRDVNPLEYPLKSIYLIVLFLMTLVILLAATWFGFYLAKQLAIPLVQLGRATKRIAGGDYTLVEVRSGSEEITGLVESFNQMTQNLENSEREVRSANQNLKQTLSDLDKHNRYIEVVLKSVSAGVISVDARGMITTINRHAGRLLKIQPENFIGRPVKELLTIEYFRIFAEMIKSMQDHQIESIQRELKLEINGETIPLQMTLSMLKDESGTDLGKILVFDDMTMILNAQRSAAWSEVARRIAHEIKNPLTPIKLSAERLQRKFGKEVSDPAFQECTSMIIAQTEGLKNLVNEFSQFARLPQLKPTAGNVNHVLQEALSLFRTSHPQVEFICQLDPNLPEFMFDHEQLRRVFVNLVDNAIAACKSEPVIQIWLTSSYAADFKILRLSVEDNGTGIPAQQRSRVFEPYFSTKSEGTGLGLAIVKRIVEDHGGFIRALGREPKGTKMVMEFPLQTAPSKQA
jgi:two-component system nitrogen regulation sensor histidine kinase NtrY